MNVFRLRKLVVPVLLACGMALPISSQAQVVTIISGLQKSPATDGSQALNVQVSGMSGLVINNVGDIFFTSGHTVRKITANGILETLAGSVASGKTGDGGPAKLARLNNPGGVALDKEGNLYVADKGNACVRKIDTKGIITTVAGFGGAGYNSNDTLAIHAQLNEPDALSVDDSGRLYIADTKNSVIRRLEADGRLRTVAGAKNGSILLHADTTMPSNKVALTNIKGMVVLKNGDIIYSDNGYCAVRRITADGMVKLISGSGKCVSSGDNAPALSISLNNPVSLTKDKDDNIYVAELIGKLRKIDQNGIMTTIAGAPGSRIRSGKATDVALAPQYISSTDEGDIVIYQPDRLIAYYTAKYGGEEEKMTVFPNPCQKFTNVVLPSTFAEAATVFAIDASGRVVTSSTGTTNRNISLYFRDAGVYTLWGVTKHGNWAGKVSVAVGE